MLSPDTMYAQELEQFKAIIRKQDAEVTALKAKLVGRLIDVTCCESKFTAVKFADNGACASAKPPSCVILTS